MADGRSAERDEMALPAPTDHESSTASPTSILPITRRIALIGGTAAAVSAFLPTSPASARSAPATRVAATTAAAAVQIVSRAQWGAKPPQPDQTYTWMPWQGGVAIHYKGNTDGWDPAANHNDCFGQMREIQDKGMEGEGSDIAYNFVVCQHGVIFEGRGMGIRSAANDTETKGANQDYYAIMSLIGSTSLPWGSDDQPSAAMLAAIRNLIGHLRLVGKAGPRIRGHRDLATTECPGIALYQYVTNGSLEPPPIPPSPPAPLNTILRAQWGARPPVAVTRVPITTRTGFTVHYSAGTSATTPRQIQNYHMDSNGWSDIGYNFLVDVAGRVYEGRGWEVEGAHASGHNVTHLGVCFIGSDGDVTPAVLRSIRSIYDRANALSGKTLAKTWHGGLSGNSTACPGSQLRTWVQAGMVSDDVPGMTDPPPSSGGMGGGMTSVRTVAAQQKAVNDAGYSPALVVDGFWGPKTDAGVRWLQGRLGVTADGLWGPNTEVAYQAQINGSAPGGGMSSVRSTASQQRAVNNMGYSPALVVDGFWGPSTDTGVRWLQGRLGVTADGLWGPGTEAAYQAYYDEGALLAVDGDFGPGTIRATQRALGTTVDGQWGPASIRALQSHLNNWSNAGLAVDGGMGPGTIKALQRHLNTMIAAGLSVDGIWGYATIAALQKALNRARF
ncbi:peptidoglycan-binding domain-containing protein [Micromonospora foliorum]|uniref:peptidoglycan-binding domain-containing protein n=1 Tax=Micromonospora foliorum TaxID=2911210 RepID=UPI001EE903F0|nr:peptidoglycan-binding domain-containing protein [Micromonospora foliorum]MCG5436249.1 peptidoglycan-binding domain-containing protein [Micromonospora foliorum]